MLFSKNLIPPLLTSALLIALAGCSTEKPKPGFDYGSYERQKQAAQQADHELDREVQKIKK